MPVENSRLKGFYKLSVPERRAKLAELAGLTDEQVKAWADAELDEGTADRMIENVIGRYSLPIGVATNFIIALEQGNVFQCFEDVGVPW